MIAILYVVIGLVLFGFVCFCEANGAHSVTSFGFVSKFSFVWVNFGFFVFFRSERSPLIYEFWVCFQVSVLFVFLRSERSEWSPFGCDFRVCFQVLTLYVLGLLKSICLRFFCLFPSFGFVCVFAEKKHMQFERCIFWNFTTFVWNFFRSDNYYS